MASEREEAVADTWFDCKFFLSYSSEHKTMRGSIDMKIGLFLIAFFIYWFHPSWVMAQEERKPIMLVNYSDFPGNWKIRGDEERVLEVYQVKRGGDGPFLSSKVKGEPIRIFKKISWNPYTHPILTWKWRVHQWPSEGEASIYFYVSLDRDLLGIPTIIKYLWSDDLPVGSKKDGGFFRPTEVVIRSGKEKSGEWRTEKINALESFREVFQSDPDQEAVGIGLLVSTGVEVDISTIIALPEGH